jgi:hypothetical protein
VLAGPSFHRASTGPIQRLIWHRCRVVRARRHWGWPCFSEWQSELLEFLTERLPNPYETDAEPPLAWRADAVCKVFREARERSELCPS